MHMWNAADVKEGLAKKCPASFDDAYSHTRGDCPFCFGVGYVSVEVDPARWVSATGNPTTDPTDIPAPLYGGFGEPTITWAVLPDVATDVFRINEAGALIRTQEAEAWTYWNPEMYDNDLIVEVALGSDGSSIVGTGDRFQLKMVNPQTIRGWGRRSGNTQNIHQVGQNFHMNLVPAENVLWNVPVGGINYGAY
jgi:hypothetical protein